MKSESEIQEQYDRLNGRLDELRAKMDAEGSPDPHDIWEFGESVRAIHYLAWMLNDDLPFTLG